MIGDLVRKAGDRLFAPVNAGASWFGITKTGINLLELAAGCAVGLAFATSLAGAGWLLLLCHGFLDYLDGGTRRTGLRSGWELRPLGIDTHVAVDKISEVAMFAGMTAGSLAPFWLALAALAGSLAGTIFGQLLLRRGLSGLEHTIFDRADRIIGILAIAPLLGYSAALAASCAMSGITIFQRAHEFRTGTGLTQTSRS